MATYVCSDIHGCFDKFKWMLEGINFDDDDILYIIGDICDRGKQNVAMIEYVRSKDNIVLLKGNHEQLLVDYYNSIKDKTNWNDDTWFRNGGYETHKELKALGEDYISDVVKYFEQLPSVLLIDHFVIVHGGFDIDGQVGVLEEVLNANTEYDVIWNREFIKGTSRIDGYTIVCGHTPTLNFNTNCIVHKDGAILIDCGCVFDGGNLACLRLDDLEEFYF